MKLCKIVLWTIQNFFFFFDYFFAYLINLWLKKKILTFLVVFMGAKCFFFFLDDFAIGMLRFFLLLARYSVLWLSYGLKVRLPSCCLIWSNLASSACYLVNLLILMSLFWLQSLLIEDFPNINITCFVFRNWSLSLQFLLGNLLLESLLFVFGILMKSLKNRRFWTGLGMERLILHCGRLMSG